jgi:hypothetical protein
MIELAKPLSHGMIHPDARPLRGGAVRVVLAVIALPTFVLAALAQSWIAVPAAIVLLWTCNSSGSGKGVREVE